MGDVPWLIDETQGNFLANPEPGDLADKLSLAIAFGPAAGGRNRLRALGLDLGTVARRLLFVYEDVLREAKARS